MEVSELRTFHIRTLLSLGVYYSVARFCGVLMLQVSLALRESTERSLIILDEFGKGTATVSFTKHSAFDTISKWVGARVTCRELCVLTNLGGRSVSVGCLTAPLAITWPTVSQCACLNPLSQCHPAKAIA